MIVVTGGSGFLGGAVARALSKRGDSVRVLVRASSDARDLARAGIATGVGDILDPSSLAGVFAGAREVIHAAGMLGRAGQGDAEYLRVHVQGTMNVLRAARDAGATRVVYLSSPGLLGPIAKDAPDAGEDAPPRPTNAYERSKAATEDALRDDASKHGPIAVIVRPEFVYGPGDRHVLRLFRTIKHRRFFYFGRGDALCHPTYIDDAVAGVLAAAQLGKPGRVYHIAGPASVPIRELVETVARALGVAPPFLRLPERPVRLALRLLEPLARRAGVTLPLSSTGVDFFTFDRHFSVQRAKDELGFHPSIALAEGVRRTVRWYEDEGLL